MFGVKDPLPLQKKDPLPVKLRSGVVYMFALVGCNACYVGGTVRHISTRVKEQLSSIRSSCIFKHLQIDPFTVTCSVNWPLIGGEAGGDLVFIQTSPLLLSCKCI